MMKRIKRESPDRWLRKIIHVDMDAFFASVEQRDNPALRGKPVVVGGDPHGRGVVSTCSYEARRFGVHSAMPAAAARRLCPAAIFLRPRFRVYEEISSTIRSILRGYTAKVEPVSLDEAYLDVTENRLRVDDPAALASLIKQHILGATRLTASAGVAPNLFLAKVASDFDKPDGLTVIAPREVTAFLENLPLRKIPGVGPVTEKKLLSLGWKTCGELAAVPPAVLKRHFGKFGWSLLEMARGIDDREVEPDGEPKQYGQEETFERDALDREWMAGKLREYAGAIAGCLAESGRRGRTVVLKVKYNDFETITRSHTFPGPVSGWKMIYDAACNLLAQKTEAGSRPVRLLGLSIRFSAGPESGLQTQELFADNQIS
jgi:DNA polymerase-4